MNRIREKATESEAVVQNITREIQVLDLAKKNLSISLSALRRLQSFGSWMPLTYHFRIIVTDGVRSLAFGINELAELIQSKRYTDIANTLAVRDFRLDPQLYLSWIDPL